MGEQGSADCAGACGQFPGTHGDGTAIEHGAAPRRDVGEDLRAGRLRTRPEQSRLRGGALLLRPREALVQPVHRDVERPLLQHLHQEPHNRNHERVLPIRQLYLP